MLYMSISWAYARPEYKFVKRVFAAALSGAIAAVAWEVP
jgi:hypothetical protein